MSVVALFDQNYYLSNNKDVADAIASGHFSDALSHYILYGGLELRAPNITFDPIFYAVYNSDVLDAVSLGQFQNVFEHYQKYGELENRVPVLAQSGFDAAAYLLANPDVEEAIEDGEFTSALDHYITFGKEEARSGSGLTDFIFELTAGDDLISGTNNNDTFVAGDSSLNSTDRVDGGGGTDTLQVISLGPITLPAASNFLGVENLILSNTQHQTLDFSIFTDLKSVSLRSGTTIDGSPITIKLGPEQALTLDSIKDGDTSSDAVSDGGIIIAQSRQDKSLELILDDIGPSDDTKKDVLFIDVAGQDVEIVNITSSNTNFVSIVNSGRKMSTLNILGGGTLNVIGSLPESVTAINGAVSTGGTQITTGSDDDSVALSAGNDVLNTGTGNDTVTASGGKNDVVTGPGNDTVTLHAGSNTLDTGTGDDFVTLSTGNDIVTTGPGDDIVVISAGNNDVNTGSDDDRVTITGGSTFLDTGFGNDTITLSGGINVVHMRIGSDKATLSSGTNFLFMDEGADILLAQGGTNTVEMGAGDDVITLSNGTNTIDAGAGDDIIDIKNATVSGLATVLGGTGTDTINIIASQALSLPTTSSIETISITDTQHQTLDFSSLDTVSNILLKSGTTVDGASITTTLGAGQTLTLNSITDGDTAAAALGDGGIVIAQASTITSLMLILDDVGPSVSTPNENLFVDVAGAGVTTATIQSGNDSFIVFSNSGGSLGQVNLTGSGTMAIGSLPNSVTGVNGAAATANLILTMGTGSNTITGGSGNDEINLTGGTNNVDAGPGDDTIQIPNNLAVGDSIDGGDGTDTLVFVHTGTATVPTTTNITSIERIAISDTVHQTLNFTSLSTISGIELDSGTTIDGATITTTIGSGQSLTLDSITDGDTAAASLADGGIVIAQDNSITSLDLTIDDVGPASATVNENVFIDIAGRGITTGNITSNNTSFIVLSNSGGALATLNLSGSGTLGIENTLPDRVTTISGASSTANLTLTTGTGNDTITTGSGGDTITLKGGTNNVTTNAGNDTVTLSTGTDTVNTGAGNDNVNASAGNNTIDTGNNNDSVTLTGGANGLDTGSGNDTVNASSGTNTIDTSSGNDTITLSGGVNGIDTGSGNDNVTLSGGTNDDVITGTGSDTVNASNGTNDIYTGDNNDTVTLSGGSNTLDTGANNDTVTLSGGTNNVDTGADVDQVNASGGSNTINTGSGSDTLTLSGGTNNANTGTSNDTVSISGGTNTVVTGDGSDELTLGGVDTVNTGNNNDIIDAAASLTTADTIDGGSGTDTLLSTIAITDALAARLSNIEVFDIKGGNGITHDLSNLTGLTSLKASGAIGGAVSITDLAAGASVDISSALGNNLTINQINAAGGGDTISINLSGSGYTTNGAVIAPGIETVTINVSASGDKTLSGVTLADASSITVSASSDDLIISDLTAVNMSVLDLSSTSNRTVDITTGADVFTQAFTYTGGGRNDTLNTDGATVVAGTTYVVGNYQDTLILNADAVANVVRTSATDSSNAFSIQDDASTGDTPGFTSGSDTFDYNGALSHAGATGIVVAAGATLAAAVAADADATVYVIQDADGNSNFESALNSFADNVGTGRANTMERRAADSDLLSYAGLDAAFDASASDAVLIVIDSETNEDGGTANNGGTAVYRFENSNTSSVDTVSRSELELIGVFQDAALGAGDFV